MQLESCEQLSLLWSFSGSDTNGTEWLHHIDVELDEQLFINIDTIVPRLNGSFLFLVTLVKTGNSSSC